MLLVPHNLRYPLTNSITPKLCFIDGEAETPVTGTFVFAGISHILFDILEEPARLIANIYVAKPVANLQISHNNCLIKLKEINWRDAVLLSFNSFSFV